MIQPLIKANDLYRVAYVIGSLCSHCTLSCGGFIMHTICIFMSVSCVLVYSGSASCIFSFQPTSEEFIKQTSVKGNMLATLSLACQIFWYFCLKTVSSFGV
jgi:hypothetical protein